MKKNKINLNKLGLLGISKAFGVDFNGHKLRLMQLKKDGKKQKVGGWAEKNIPSGLLDNFLIYKKEEFRELFLSTIKQSKRKIRGGKIVVSLPENKVFTRIITIPLMEKKEAEEPVRWETESNIPISVDEVYFDWQIVKKRKKEMDVLVVASPMKIIDNYLDFFSEIGFQVIAFEPKSIATGRSVIERNSEECVLVADLGLENTSYAIYEQGVPVFTSSGAVSGKLLTDLVMKNLGLTLEKAESYKIKTGLGYTTEEKQKAFPIFESALTTFVQETKKTINFYNETLGSQRTDSDNPEREISKIILTGGGSNLKGFNSYLAINLQERIEQSNPWLNVGLKKDIPPISKESSQGFSTLIGLAIRAYSYESYD